LTVADVTIDVLTLVTSSLPVLISGIALAAQVISPTVYIVYTAYRGGFRNLRKGRPVPSPSFPYITMATMDHPYEWSGPPRVEWTIYS